MQPAFCVRSVIVNERLTALRQCIADAAQRSGRRAGDIRLVAVSKKQPLDAIRQLADQGQVDFGESTVQEARKKVAACPQLVWHGIGHLQSNKARQAVGLFDWLHAIDSEKLLYRVSQAAEQAEKHINILLQVNIARDPDKFGFAEDGLFPVVESLLDKQLARTRLRGLMTIGQRNVSDSQTRRTFAGLRRLAEQARLRFGDVCFTELSMGMSQDFEIAIEEGATMVRVGTALFGERS